MVTCTPDVKLNAGADKSALDWFEITRYGQYAGDILASFELLLVSYIIYSCMHTYMHTETYTHRNTHTHIHTL